MGEEEFYIDNITNLFIENVLSEEEKLLDQVDGVDCDVESYARRLDELLSTKIAKLRSLQSSVQAFRSHLSAEEKASKQVKGGFRF